jgi:hypothetical protein
MPYFSALASAIAWIFVIYLFSMGRKLKKMGKTFLKNDYNLNFTNLQIN